MEGQTVSTATNTSAAASLGVITNETTGEVETSTEKPKTMPWGGPNRGTKDAPKKSGENPTSQAKGSEKASTTDAEAKKDAEAKAIEEFEELIMGSNKFKVQKGLAPILKQWERAIQKKQQEIAQQKKELESIDEETFFKKKGKNAKDWAEQLLIKELDAAALTPEQRELNELKAWKAEQEKAQKEFETKQNEERESVKTQEDYKKTVDSFIKTCSEVDLPPLQGIMTLVAMELERSHRFYEQGKIEKPLTELEAANKIKSDLKALNKSIFSSVNPDQLEDLIGGDVLKKYQDWDIGRKTANPLQAPSQPKNPVQPTASQNKKVQLNETQLREWKEAGRPPFHEFLKTLKKKK